MGRDIQSVIANRVLLLDGAMGTMIQDYGLAEEDYRGTRFVSSTIRLQGNHDLLSLTRPDIISEIHEKYLAAGADIIETNTFNSNRISMADYQMEGLVPELNLTAAKIAVAAAEKYSELTPGKPRFVAGSIGPTNKSASISPYINDPAFRSVTFDDLYSSYQEQAESLINGGVDLLLIETIFDTLNAKAAVKAVLDLLNLRNLSIPVMVSVTLSDKSGRTLSGQTIEAFLYSMSFPSLFSVGLNCSMGAEALRPFLEILSEKASCYVSIHPNAGLPDEFGNYQESPEQMSVTVKDFLENRLVNIIGGCCGTTPEHIREFSLLTEKAVPRSVPQPDHELHLSGLDPLTIYQGSNFINIGERTNISGSRQFARLIREEKYEEALQVARQQVENGAQVIDVNVDEAMIDGEQAMTRFLHTLSSDPEVARVPVMIDSGNWKVIEAGLKCLQGRGIVNSISLKEGESVFKERAGTILSYGSAVVVMAFDEQGQATTFERKTEICRRAFGILVRDVDFPASGIIFDPNVLAVGTGMEEHHQYAVDFLKATSWIKQNLPYVKVSGGVSNLSFSFRGNNTIREAIHSVFLYHAVQAGMDMGIVNAGVLQPYNEIPSELVMLVEDVILNRKTDATEHLIRFAETLNKEEKRKAPLAEWRDVPVGERIKHAIIRGQSDHIIQDVEEALKEYSQPYEIIEGPLMQAMNEVGDLFGNGKMFLPQVIRSARVMKLAVSFLLPHIEATLIKKGKKNFSSGKIILATVKGDIHDIGKNIVSVVMACNNYEIIDLGVMVTAEKIVRTAIDVNADIIGLSGLITPSLEEMVHVAREMKRMNVEIPLLIGGATTSAVHTAVRIAPQCDGPVIHLKDASESIRILAELMHPEKKVLNQRNYKQQSELLRNKYEQKTLTDNWITLEEARRNKFVFQWDSYPLKRPGFSGIKVITDHSLEELIPHIDWNSFFLSWKIDGKYPGIFSDPEKGEEARRLFEHANQLLKEIMERRMIIAKGVVGIFPCNAVGDDVEIYTDDNRSGVAGTLHFLRNQQKKNETGFNFCLADFILPSNFPVTDYIGLFAVTTGIGLEKWEDHFRNDSDDFSSIQLRFLAHQLADAFAEKIHHIVGEKLWGFVTEKISNREVNPENRLPGIRPAPGYPACPDHSEKRIIFDLLDAEKNLSVSLTGNFTISPSASVCGYIIANPESHYFAVGKIGKDQIIDYSKRKNCSFEQAENLLLPYLNYP